MAKIWLLEKFDGQTPVEQKEVPAVLSDREVEEMLRRLVCKDLDNDEIIDSSLRPGMKNYRTLLEKVGSGVPLSFGQNPHWTARKVDR